MTSKKLLHIAWRFDAPSSKIIRAIRTKHYYREDPHPKENCTMRLLSKIPESHAIHARRLVYECAQNTVPFVLRIAGVDFKLKQGVGSVFLDLRSTYLSEVKQKLLAGFDTKGIMTELSKIHEENSAQDLSSLKKSAALDSSRQHYEEMDWLRDLDAYQRHDSPKFSSAMLPNLLPIATRIQSNKVIQKTNEAGSDPDLKDVSLRIEGISIVQSQVSAMFQYDAKALIAAYAASKWEKYHFAGVAR